MRSVPKLEWVVMGQCEVSQHLSIRSWDNARCPNARSCDSVKCPNTRTKGLETVRSVPALEWVVLGQCEVSQHLSIRSWDSARRPKTRSWDSVKCPNTRTKGLGKVRSAPTLEWVVLGQCEVSQHLSIRSWESARCPNTRSCDHVKCPNTRAKDLGTEGSVATLE